MCNERAAALFGVLCGPGQKLCMVGWDSWQVKVQKPSNHTDQRATFSTKIKANSMSHMEGCDMEGRPVFTFNLSSSISPRSTDEAICFYTIDLEARAGLAGGFTSILVGRPEYCMVHLFDNGFR